MLERLEIGPFVAPGRRSTSLVHNPPHALRGGGLHLRELSGWGCLGGPAGIWEGFRDRRPGERGRQTRRLARRPFGSPGGHQRRQSVLKHPDRALELIQVDVLLGGVI